MSITLTVVTDGPDHCDNQKCPFFITMQVPEDYEDWADFCTAPIYNNKQTAKCLSNNPWNNDHHPVLRTQECKTTFT